MNNNYRRRRRGFRPARAGNYLVGLIFLGVGAVLLLREMGLAIPPVFFRWEMIMILVGIVSGFRSGFRDYGWIVVIAVGLFFLSDEIFPDLETRRYVLPVAILGVGAFIILKRLSSSPDGLKTHNGKPEQGFPIDPGNPETPGTSPIANTALPLSQQTSPTITSRPDDGFRSGFRRMDEDAASGDPVIGEVTDSYNRPAAVPRHPAALMQAEELDVVSVFSAVNKKVFSKNFRGGEIVCVFGGSEIDLMNADISEGPIELEVVCIFGGATLFIPPNWYVKSDMGSVFGGVDDKRKNTVPDLNKVIVIKGVCIFGGMEIKTRY